MQMQMVKKQQGFTIIELVVVILLLGILAATALPRFLDVTEEAHEAAFDGSVGGFTTGLALYRAQWVGNGQPPVGSSIQELNNLFVAPSYTARSLSNNVAGALDSTRSSGYPIGAQSVTTLAGLTSERCVEVFEGVLQGGAASLNPATAMDLTTVNDAVAFRTSITNTQEAAPADFQVFAFETKVDTNIPVTPAPTGQGLALDYEDDSSVCVYVYTAEAGNADRSIVYVPWTGAIVRNDSISALFESLTDSGVRRVP